eukprot:UN06847
MNMIFCKFKNGFSFLQDTKKFEKYEVKFLQAYKHVVFFSTSSTGYKKH